MRYDVIGLNEVKTRERIYLPGYVCYRNTVTSDRHRGGTVVLVRRCLQSSVMCVDVKMKDQIWLRLSHLANVLLGFVYVPPTDSQYFNPISFSYMQEKIIRGEEENCRVLILGDLNARFGPSVRDILPSIVVPGSDNCTYPVIPDQVNRPNDNAQTMSTICMEQKLVVINNLKIGEKHFKSNLT